MTKLPDLSPRQLGIILFSLCFVFFLLTNYGGVRSPDSEVVFRTAESLAHRGELDIHDLDSWKEFGVARGKDQKYYSVFGPLESILLAPFIKAAGFVNTTRWYESARSWVPYSYYVNEGPIEFPDKTPHAAPEPHSLRLLVSVFNPLVSAFCVVTFWFILLRLTNSIRVSFIVSLVFAFSTVLWWYSGTFFSEPLATFFVLLSFLLLLQAVLQNTGKTVWPVISSGLFLGLASASHITSILFAPFFALYFWFRQDQGERDTWGRVAQVSFFSLGCFVVLFMLGYYNYARFGNFFETGRTVNPVAIELYGYGVFVPPFRGLYGLTLGAGRGLLLFSPLCVWGLLQWKYFQRVIPKLSLALSIALVFRLLFVASRSDWHGGFCMGPRQLVVTIPFLLLPIAFWLSSKESVGNKSSFVWFGFGAFLSASEQLYLTLGESFRVNHIIKAETRSQGLNVFKDDLLYVNWDYSPLFTLGGAEVSPFVLRQTGLTIGELWLIGTIILLLLFTAVLIAFVPLTSRAATHHTQN